MSRELNKYAERASMEQREAIEEMDLDYEYPRGLDLHPKTDLHKKLVQYVCDRARIARQVTETAKEEWERMDWTLNAYMPASEADAAVKAKDSRKPVTVVIPMTFASMETYLTYMQSTFLQDPIHRYKGVGEPRDRIAAALLERVVGRQNIWFKEGLHLDSFWRDAFTYGIGLVAPRWTKHRVQAPRDTEVTDVLFELLKDADLGEINKGDMLRTLEEKVLFEGTELQNIDMYQALLDPNTTPNRIQQGEFIGWMYRTHAMDILRRESDPEERMFNGRAVYRLAEGGCAESKWYMNDESGRNRRQGTEDLYGNPGDDKSRTVDITQMFIDLIPRDWNLGDEDYPQKWMFAVAGDEVLIQAQPLDLDHGMFPVACCAPNTDGHSVVPVSHLATTYGLQQSCDWFMKSRIDNVRKSINDMIIVDPSRIEWDDILNPNPGKLIRAKNVAMGEGNLDRYIKQLNVSDVTANHPRDVSTFIQLMREANGTVDIAMGDLSGLPERPTATGIQAAQSGALSRLARLARIVGAQSMQDIAWQEAFNTLQFMERDVAVEIIGRQEQYLRTEYGMEDQAMVSPMDLTANFEVIPSDGSMPQQDNISGMTEVMKTLFGVEGVGLDIAANVRVFNMFLQYARKLGFEDVQEFVQAGGAENTQILPDEQLAQQAQAGNLVSLDQVAA